MLDETLPMKQILTFTLLLLGNFSLFAAGWPPEIDSSKDSTINGRAVETFDHASKPEWGYKTPQVDTFAMVHPKTARENAPLYVVLHSAGHDAFSSIECTKTIGDHDIYHSPDDHYALFLDCRKHEANDWWWGGMHRRDKGLVAKNSGKDTVPVEKRVIDTVAWAIEHYKIDPNRVYLSGNSMGGSGALGIGMRHGDVFAAIKANVPAGIGHVAERLCFPPKSIPEGMTLPDPPICLDYSAQNDDWSFGHDRLANAMNERKYPYLFYWGPFGHENNSARVMKVNDLLNSFDWLSVKKNEAYPVFTNASSNSPLPWPDDLESTEAGQINAFFRWKMLEDTTEVLETSLFLISADDLQTRFEIPKTATADVSLRRLQNFKHTPGTSFRWQFGTSQGQAKSDARGLLTVPGLTITSKPATLLIQAKAHEPDARLHADGKGWRLDKAKVIDPKRPHVLLIGDSILNGYFMSVVTALQGKAYVDAWVNPHWQSEGTNKLLADLLTNNAPYDVVHFNMGLHGWTEGRIADGTFETLTKAYVDVLKTKLPKAKLIWASSTPVTAKGNPTQLEPQINPIIVEHNRLAAKVMKEAGVPVNDFYAMLDAKRSLAKGDCFHWTGPAYKLLGQKAVDSIVSILVER